MRKTLIGLSLITMIAATAAQAQSGTPAPPPMRHGLMGVQADAQGNITRTAVMAAADSRFAAMDANHDGTVTPDEMRAYRDQKRAERGMGQPQGDRPGRRAPQPITADAFRARAAAMFDRLDTNHDGKIDAQERAAAPRQRGHWGRHGGPGEAAPTAQPMTDGN